MGNERRPQRRLAIGIGVSLVAVLALLWAVLGERHGSGARPTERPAIASAEDAEPPSPADAAPTATTPAERTTIDERTILPDAHVAPTSPADALRIEVVDATTDEFVAGADVIYLDLGLGATAEDRDALSRFEQIDAILARRSHVARTTDELGVARVPRPIGPAAAVARKDGRFGLASIVGAAEQVRVRIAPDWPLPIQVVDRAGHGIAGVPVALRQRYGREDASDWITARTEGPDGIARVPHAGAIACRYSNENWLAAVAAVVREPLEQVIDPSSPPVEPVRFELPESGRLSVELLDVDGSAFLGPAWVTVRAATGASSAHLPASVARALARKASAAFDFVELGLMLDVDARPSSQPNGARTRVSGPRVPGATASAVLRFGADAPVLQVRVVRPGGEPVASRDLHATLQAAGAPGSFFMTAMSSTDADGRFRLGLPPEQARRSGLVLAIRDRATGETAPGVAIPDGLAPGLHELGVVELGAGQLIAEGAVVDTAGNPIEEATVYPHVRVSSDKGAGNGFRWRASQGHSARSDAAGRFVLRGDLGTLQPILVAAIRGGFAAEGVECALGASEVRIVLSREGRLAGRVVADPGVPADLLRVIVSDGEDWQLAAPALRRYWSRSLDKSGRFDLEGIAAGIYWLRVLGSEDQALAEIPGLAVESGQTCSDPRLAEIDLRGRLGGITLRIVDRAGRRVPHGRVRLRASDWHEGLVEVVDGFNGGEFRALRTSPALDLTVVADGFRVAELEGVEGDREVVLEPGIRVRLALADPSSLPNAPVHLTPLLQRPDGAMWFRDYNWEWPDLDEHGEVVLELPAPGSYALQWMVRRRSTRGALSTEPVGPEANATIQVADADDGQVFELKLDAQPVASAVERLDERAGAGPR